jgi:3-oxoisoapionate decarboxylase
MNAGIGTYALRYAISHPELPEEKRMSLMGVFDFCRSNKIEYLQICDNIPLHQIPEKEVHECSKQALNFGLHLEIGTTGYSYEHLNTYCDLAVLFGSKILRTVLGLENPAIQESDARKEIRKIIPVLEKNNVILAIENHFDMDPCCLKQFIDSFSHPLVKVCLDPLNSISLFWGINETFKILQEYIVSAHIKDARIKREGSGFRISGCKLGEGMANVDNYLLKLSKNNIDCNVFLEQWLDKEAGLEETLQKEQFWVKDGMMLLKNSLETMNN